MPTVSLQEFDNKLAETVDRWAALPSSVRQRVFFISAPSGRVWDGIQHVMDEIEQHNPEKYKAFHLPVGALVSIVDVPHTKYAYPTPVRYAMNWLDLFNEAMDWVEKGKYALIRAALDIGYVLKRFGDFTNPIPQHDDFRTLIVEDADVIAQTYIFKFSQCDISNYETWCHRIEGDTPDWRLSKLIVYASYADIDADKSGVYSSCLAQTTTDVVSPYMAFGVVARHLQLVLPD